MPLAAEAALDLGGREPGADGKPRLAVNARSKRAGDEDPDGNGWH